MSKKRDREEYEKTWAYRFREFLSGAKDPYIGTMEMKVQEKNDIPEEVRVQHAKDRIAKENERIERMNKGHLRWFDNAYYFCGAILTLGLILLLLMTVVYLPENGRSDNPDNNEVVSGYIENGLQDTGSVNIVTGMILSYRAFDTFGETCVLFIATSCVMILLMISEEKLKKEAKKNDRQLEPKNDIILQTVASFLVPIIFIFGIYVMLNGHLSPGGGFSGGAMVGAGMILYVCAFGFAKTERFFNENIYKIIKVGSLCTYGLMITYYFICGANGINNHIPLGTPGKILSAGLILPINLCVGFEVACTMYAFYALFRRGGL